MAITKILYRNGGLRQAIDYITNPVKTDENLLTDYIRCDPGYAAQQMMDTKRALGKTAGRQCYHIIQSFKPDEITPELAHEIARQFAAEHLPGYEAVIATHVDKTHIHSHIVFNSVNAVTGKMYHSTRENYYKQIRGVSDRLCKAHGLSIILESDEKKAVSYAEWLRQKKSQPTFRSMLEADLHDAIEDANDLGHFFLLMEHSGYEIHHGKRLGFRLRGQEHFMCPERRNPDFSEERIEQAILGNLEQIEAGKESALHTHDFGGAGKTGHHAAHQHNRNTHLIDADAAEFRKIRIYTRNLDLKAALALGKKQNIGNYQKRTENKPK